MTCDECQKPMMTKIVADSLTIDTNPPTHAEYLRCTCTKCGAIVTIDLEGRNEIATPRY